MKLNPSFLWWIVILLFLIGSPLRSQVDVAMIFLRNSPSPLLNGMGQVGTALLTEEVYALYYNPAHLGLVSRHNNAVLSIYPAQTDWLPGLQFSDLKLYSMAVNLGYEFKNIWRTLTLRAGLGYMYTKLDLGSSVVTDEQGNIIGRYESWENYNALCAGLGIEYYIQLSFGLALKHAKSELGLPEIQVGAETRSTGSESDMIDYGFHIFVPILRFYTDPIKNSANPQQAWLPEFDFSLGYTKANIGDPVPYYLTNLPLPLPRTARLGYAVSIGLDWYYNSQWFKIFSADYSVDALDLLIDKEHSNRIQSGLLGDIHIGNNLLKGNADQNVDVHKDYRFRFFETFQILSGSWDGENWNKPVTSGFAFTLKGLFKYLASVSDNQIIQYIGRHFDLQYVYSKVDVEGENPWDGTEYQSLTI